MDEDASLAERRTLRGADANWISTNISVRAGDEVRITASGIIQFGTWDPLRGPFPRDPDGRDPRGQTEHPASRFGDGHPAPDCTKNSLVARIGSYVVQVGSQKSFRSPAAGVLEITNNDNYCTDNAGEWTVTIEVVDDAPRPGALHHNVLVVVQPGIWSAYEGSFREAMTRFPRIVAEATRGQLQLHVEQVQIKHPIAADEWYEYVDPHTHRPAPMPKFSERLYRALAAMGPRYDLANMAACPFHTVFRQYLQPDDSRPGFEANTWGYFNEHLPFLGQPHRRPAYIAVSQVAISKPPLETASTYVHELCHALDIRFHERGVEFLNPDGKRTPPHAFFDVGNAPDLEYYRRILGHGMFGGAPGPIPYHRLGGWSGVWHPAR